MLTEGGRSLLTTCTRRLHFCAGHRVLGHENKCSTPHGHNYVAFVHAMAPLDGIGRVIDFSVLKDLVGGWIDRNWDHAFICYDKDVSLFNALDTMRVTDHQAGMTKHRPIFLANFNPTAEEIANHLLRVVCPKVLEGTGVEVVKVDLWETENCHATASRLV